MSAREPRIVLHIDRLVLRGVSAAERDAVVETLRRSLEETLARGGLPEGLREGSSGSRRLVSHLASLRVPAFTVAAEAGPKGIGRAAGEGVGEGLKR